MHVTCEGPGSPMFSSILISWACAGVLVIDARVPTEVYAFGEPVAQIFQPAILQMELPTGKAALILYLNGKPQAIDIDIPVTGEARLLVGRTGVSTGQSVVTADAVPSLETLNFASLDRKPSSFSWTAPAPALRRDKH